MTDQNGQPESGHEKTMDRHRLDFSRMKRPVLFKVMKDKGRLRNSPRLKRVRKLMSSRTHAFGLNSGSDGKGDELVSLNGS